MTLPISPISNRWEWPCDMHRDLFRASRLCGFHGGPCSAGWATNFQSPGCWLSMVYLAPLTQRVLPQHRLRDGWYEGSDGRILCHGLSFPFPVPPKSFSSMQTPNRRLSETWEAWLPVAPKSHFSWMDVSSISKHECISLLSGFSTKCAAISEICSSDCSFLYRTKALEWMLLTVPALL